MKVGGVDLGTKTMALALVEFPWLRVHWGVTLEPKFPRRQDNCWVRLRVLCEQVRLMAPALCTVDVLAVELPRHLIGDGQRLMVAMGPVLAYLAQPGVPLVMTNPNKGLPDAYVDLFDAVGRQVQDEHQVDAVRAAVLGHAAWAGDPTMGEVFVL